LNFDEIWFNDENTSGYNADEIAAMNDTLKFRIAELGIDIRDMSLLTDVDNETIRRLATKILEENI
jgi:hypothetical protein